MSQRRNIGGARHEASERIRLQHASFVAEGWTLNVSRGGVRVVLEQPVQLGGTYDVFVGDGDQPRKGRVVWVRDEADGQIVGVQFLDAPGAAVPPDDAVPPPSDGE